MKQPFTEYEHNRKVLIFFKNKMAPVFRFNQENNSSNAPITS